LRHLSWFNVCEFAVSYHYVHNFSCRFLFSFFFFQAEDGIRDATVTGVQTCALPISIALPRLAVEPRVLERDRRPAGEGLQDLEEIGRASCREKCRSRGVRDQ